MKTTRKRVFQTVAEVERAFFPGFRGWPTTKPDQPTIGTGLAVDFGQRVARRGHVRRAAVTGNRKKK